MAAEDVSPIIKLPRRPWKTMETWDSAFILRGTGFNAPCNIYYICITHQYHGDIPPPNYQNSSWGHQSGAVGTGSRGKGQVPPTCCNLTMDFRPLMKQQLMETKSLKWVTADNPGVTFGLIWRLICSSHPSQDQSKPSPPPQPWDQ